MMEVRRVIVGKRGKIKLSPEAQEHLATKNLVEICLPNAILLMPQHLVMEALVSHISTKGLNHADTSS